MSNSTRGKSRIAVRRAPPGFSGYVVVDTVAKTMTKPYASRAAADHRAARDRRKLGKKKPAIGTPTAKP